MMIAKKYRIDIRYYVVVPNVLRKGVAFSLQLFKKTFCRVLRVLHFFFVRAVQFSLKSFLDALFRKKKKITLFTKYFLFLLRRRTVNC